MAALAVIVLVACTAPTSLDRVSDFDARTFASFDGQTILCFDLRRDIGRPAGGLIVRATVNPPMGRRDILLPFGSTAIVPNRGLLLASGSYDTFTIMSLSTGGSSFGTPVVSFTPRTQRFATGRPQVETLEPGLYFHEDGLERWFVLVDSSTTLVNALAKEFPATKLEVVDSVAIALPANAEGRDVRRGVSVYPEPSARTANVILFDAQAKKGGGRVELRYEVPATAAQLAASSAGLKLVLVLIVPIATLIFLERSEVNRPLLRHRAILIGIVCQIAITGTVLYIAFAVRRPEASAIGDVIVGAMAIICEVVVLLVKAKPHQAPSER